MPTHPDLQFFLAPPARPPGGAPMLLPFFLVPASPPAPPPPSALVSTFARAGNYNDLLPPITLAVPHAAGAPTLVLSAGAGARLGPLPANRIFRPTALKNPGTPAEKVLGIFEATGISGDTLTGVSGAEGFGNVALAAGAAIEVRLTGKDFEEHSAAINAAEATLAAVIARLGAAGLWP